VHLVLVLPSIACNSNSNNFCNLWECDVWYVDYILLSPLVQLFLFHMK